MNEQIEKQAIEEMAKVMMGHCEIDNQCGSCHWSTCNECLAEVLYNAGYRKQEWISVEDRLPDKDGEYLTWDGLIYFLIWFNASLGLWNVSEGGDISSAIRDITHWMPLPEPPKMKGGSEEATQNYFSPEDVSKMSLREI